MAEMTFWDHLDELLHVLLRGGGIFSFYVIGQAGT